MKEVAVVVAAGEVADIREEVVADIKEEEGLSEAAAAFVEAGVEALKGPASFCQTFFFSSRLPLTLTL